MNIRSYKVSTNRGQGHTAGCVGNVCPITTVHTCIIHLIRNTFKLASKKDQDALKQDVNSIYITPELEHTPRGALEDLTEKWARTYGSVFKFRVSAW
jgi:transposase-like protein